MVAGALMRIGLGIMMPGVNYSSERAGMHGVACHETKWRGRELMTETSPAILWFHKGSWAQVADSMTIKVLEYTLNHTCLPRVR